jgi:addiction module HigA family antidote
MTMARPPIHPGEVLADELHEVNVTPTELARQINVPVNRVTQIIHGQRGITGDTALRLGTGSARRRNSGSICRAHTTFVWWRRRRGARSPSCRCVTVRLAERRRTCRSRRVPSKNALAGC